MPLRTEYGEYYAAEPCVPYGFYGAENEELLCRQREPEPKPASRTFWAWCNWQLAVCIVLGLVAAVLLVVFVTTARPNDAAAGCAADLRLPNSTHCNRVPGLCEQAVHEVVFAGMHNAIAANESEAGNAYAFARPSHHRCLRSALVAGVRALALEVHLRANNSELVLCHARCVPGNEMPLAAALASVRAFVEHNTREVVVLVWTTGYDHRLVVTDADRALLAQKLDAAYVAHGLAPLSYRHTAEGWPTLGTLVAQNKRVLSFLPESVPTTLMMPDTELWDARTCTSTDATLDEKRLAVVYDTEACAHCLGHIPNLLMATEHWNRSAVLGLANALNTLSVEQRQARFVRDTKRCS